MTNQSSMLKQIVSIPDLMDRLYPESINNVKVLLQDPKFKKVKKLILTGCGDSLCSGMAVRTAFMELTNLEIEVATAIDISRLYKKKHLVGKAQEIAIVIVSNSGHVARIIEVAKRIKEMGGIVIAITGNENSQLYKYATDRVKFNLPKFEYAPGIRSYCACLLNLYELAISMAELQKDISSELANTIREELYNLPKRLRETMERWNIQTIQQAEKFKECSSFEFVGVGSDYATGWFGYAKSLETIGRPASSLNTEDWFHMNYFIRDVYKTATILIANEKCPSLTRYEELIKVALEMGRPFLCITDDVNKSDKKFYVLSPRIKYSFLNPLIQYLPIAMMVSHIGDRIGEVYFREGKDNWSACVDCATIIKSKEVIVD